MFRWFGHARFVQQSLLSSYGAHCSLSRWSQCAGFSGSSLSTSAIHEPGNKNDLTPSKIVEILDNFIIGQHEAKKAVAIALRNRWRRHTLDPAMAQEVVPKNILMIGPTGCGKTEIARRLAKLTESPFIKVEATKYTELGYVGHDVEDIVKDLLEAGIALARQRMRSQLAAEARQRTEDRILRALLGQHSGETELQGYLANYREPYRAGGMDDVEVEMEVPPSQADAGFAHLARMLQPAKVYGNQKLSETRKMKISEARSLWEEHETEKHLQSDSIVREAIRSVESDGIVFLDEMDKIVEGRGAGSFRSGRVSSEGVQRDLLPIIEGSTVSTKHGNVSTDHILFICAGAFHSSKPSDMLAELQGRLPIRVSLKGLTADDFYRILTEPETNLIKQQTELLATEGVELTFTDEAIRTMAQLAAQANTALENIGARRLHTVMERVLAEVSFDAPELAQQARDAGQEAYQYVVDSDQVHRCLEGLLQKQDMSRYML